MHNIVNLARRSVPVPYKGRKAKPCGQSSVRVVSNIDNQAVTLIRSNSDKGVISGRRIIVRFGRRSVFAADGIKVDKPLIPLNGKIVNFRYTFFRGFLELVAVTIIIYYAGTYELRKKIKKSTIPSIIGARWIWGKKR